MTAGGSALHAPVDGAGGENTLAAQGAPRPPDIESTLAGQVQDLHRGRATTMRRATCSRRSSRASNAARRASPGTTCATWPRPTKRCRMRSSRRTRTSQSFQRNLSFEVWLTRILINGCLDRQKARTRRSRWMLPVADAGRRDQDAIERATRPSDRSPEAQLMAREWREQLIAAVQTAARSAAAGLHALSLLRSLDARRRRDDRLERIDREGAPVPRHSQAAHGHGRTAPCDLTTAS